MKRKTYKDKLICSVCKKEVKRKRANQKTCLLKKCVFGIINKRWAKKTLKEYAKYHREYRHKNAKKIRAYKRKFNKLWRKKNGYHNEENSKKRHPRKERARYEVQKAVQRGDLKKEPCIVCGNKKSQGHHENYNKPLEVIWLCALHHREVDDGRRKL